MTKLTAEKRDDAISLLQDHQKVVDALTHVSKATWASSVGVTHEDGDDDVYVSLHHTIAKKALLQQKEWIEGQLKKLDIEVA